MDPVSAATIPMGNAIGAFNQFLPPLRDIRNADVTTDTAFVAEVRTGEVAAVALTVGVGAITSGLTKSNVPITVAIVVSVGLVIMYETTLRNAKPPANQPVNPAATGNPTSFGDDDENEA